MIVEHEEESIMFCSDSSGADSTEWSRMKADKDPDAVVGGDKHSAPERQYVSIWFWVFHSGFKSPKRRERTRRRRARNGKQRHATREAHRGGKTRAWNQISVFHSWKTNISSPGQVSAIFPSSRCVCLCVWLHVFPLHVWDQHQMDTCFVESPQKLEGVCVSVFVKSWLCLSWCVCVVFFGGGGGCWWDGDSLQSIKVHFCTHKPTLKSYCRRTE